MRYYDPLRRVQTQRQHSQTKDCKTVNDHNDDTNNEAADRGRALRPEDRRIADPGVENRDQHPVGTTTGTGAGAVTGAVVGTVLGGPVGTVVGGAVGGVLGGAAGHGVAAAIKPEGDAVDGDVIPDPGT